MLTLIGSRASDSGGNSMAPAMMIDPELRPTKIDRPSDVTGLVDTGQLVGILGQDDAVAVMESIYRLSDGKMEAPGISADAVSQRPGQMRLPEVSGRRRSLWRSVGLRCLCRSRILSVPAGIFDTNEFNSDSEFRKTASVMKLVLNGFAGAGCITMGGYDYHGGRARRG